MDNQILARIATLLEIIADELYVTRFDREFEGASREKIDGQGPTLAEMWEGGGRDNMVRGIEKMRERLDSAA